ncbi:NAD(P)/FAD-dependent oxidoreductase [Nostoc sp. WHI]|uniref:NAD(P)/FAD-dependent oxidoreductase n=1 Tax=Nostoc sp. WHI TaxID=2650611 RepID=UPI0018C8422E|nr:lycopene cyclase family protein [Nostoc sp. WHI]MBG1269562.1 tryptophan halogenase [Nostoc sp. WHI]
MNNTQSQVYDVVIMGAGIAGVSQARHLLLNIPNIKVALVDPRPEERTEKDLKVGESTVEISTLFFGKELGLYDYLIENHPPKYGLNFHWPKETENTETIDDYHHIWCTRQPSLASTLMNRAKFERDVLKMNKQMGASFYNGRVVDVDLTSGDALNTVKVKLDEGYLELKAKHVVDAAGRKFIIGRKVDNVIFDSEDLYDVNNGSAWVRVKNVDRTIFHSGYDPLGATCSHYYATNHMMGHGHWVWIIPTDSQTMELSIGVAHHHQVIPAQSVNTKEKFYAFLEANHNLVYQLLKSGEDIDFHYLPRLAHKSKTLFSQDNWYVVGDAAAIFDPFYSLGMVMMTFGIESITEIVRAKLADEPDVERKRTVYNAFNIGTIRSSNHLIHAHDRQLGHASIMSWRIYLENMWWFGIIVPMYVGKWHLDLKFLRKFGQQGRHIITSLMTDVYEQCDQLIEKKANIGLMYTHRADQLPFHYYVTRDFDTYLQDSKYEPQRSNVFAYVKNTYFFVALWYLKFLWKGFGISGLLSPRNLYHVFKLLKASAESALDELIFKFKTRGLPANSIVAKARQEFESYEYQPELQPWTKNVAEQSLQSNGKNAPKAPELVNLKAEIHS